MLPLAMKPVKDPVFQTSGKQGSISMYPLFDCNNISAMPEVAPKFPSIWNGGGGSHKFE